MTNPQIGVSAQLSVRGGRAAIAFYRAAFGAVELYRVGGTDDDESVVAQLGVGGSSFWVADESPANLNFSLSVNGEVRQKSNTQYMIMGLKRQISWASQWYALEPGDIIMSGTCEGVSRVVPGDVMHCEIETIGAMDVPISAA